MNLLPLAYATFQKPEKVADKPERASSSATAVRSATSPAPGLCNDIYDRLGCEYNPSSNVEGTRFNIASATTWRVSASTPADGKTSVYTQLAEIDSINYNNLPHTPTPVPTGSCTHDRLPSCSLLRTTAPRRPPAPSSLPAPLPFRRTSLPALYPSLASFRVLSPSSPELSPVLPSLFARPRSRSSFPASNSDSTTSNTAANATGTEHHENNWQRERECSAGHERAVLVAFGTVANCHYFLLHGCDAVAAVGPARELSRVRLTPPPALISCAPSLMPSFPSLLRSRPPHPSSLQRLCTAPTSSASNSAFNTGRQSDRHHVHEGDERLERRRDEREYDAKERTVSVGEVQAVRWVLRCRPGSSSGDPLRLAPCFRSTPALD
ncbi:hypothetical protein C8R45DRAFT_1177570 [Mycena sanguinolenta]|nr:hypothetical protein C8R45DRAFT_1177570 [Mycena sanguinolenta]